MPAVYSDPAQAAPHPPNRTLKKAALPKQHQDSAAVRRTATAMRELAPAKARRRKHDPLPPPGLRLGRFRSRRPTPRSRAYLAGPTTRQRTTRLQTARRPRVQPACGWRAIGRPLRRSIRLDCSRPRRIRDDPRPDRPLYCPLPRRMRDDSQRDRSHHRPRSPRHPCSQPPRLPPATPPALPARHQESLTQQARLPPRKARAR